MGNHLLFSKLGGNVPAPCAKSGYQLLPAVFSFYWKFKFINKTNVQKKTLD